MYVQEEIEKDRKKHIGMVTSVKLTMDFRPRCIAALPWKPSTVICGSFWDSRIVEIDTTTGKDGRAECTSLFLSNYASSLDLFVCLFVKLCNR